MRTVIDRNTQQEQPDFGLYITDLKCDRCDFGAFEVMDATELRWRLACIYCGRLTEGPPLMNAAAEALTGRLDVAPESLAGLKFKEGRYGGSSLREAASTVEGVEYLRWYEKSGKSGFMRERVAEFLLLLEQCP